MDDNQSNKALPPASVSGNTNKERMDIEASGRDQASFRQSSIDQASVGTSSAINQHSTSSSWPPDNAESHLAMNRIEKMAAQNSSASSVQTTQNGQAREGISSSLSFGSSMTGQPQGQQNPGRGQMYGSAQNQGMFTSIPGTHPNSQLLMQKSSFEGSTDTRNSPVTGGTTKIKGGLTITGKAAEQAHSNENHPKLFSRLGNDSLQPSLGVPSQRIGMHFQGESQPSPNGNLAGSPSVTPRAAGQSVLNDMKAQAGHRPNPILSVPQNGPSAASNVREYGNFPMNMQASLQKQTFINTNLQHQLGGQAARSSANGPTSNAGTPTQLDRAIINASLPGPQNSMNATSNVNALVEKGKRTSPSDTSRPDMWQQHIKTQSQRPPVSRRPLPIAGAQPSRVPPSNIGQAQSQHQSPNSPGRMSSTPPGMSSYRGQLDGQHQQSRDQPPLQQHVPLLHPPPPPAHAGGMRELRVEDALLYLDDVKREFKDRPAIYNEFLAIMKNFKSQEVDTPGVIARVSKLFRGYNNLILGFNTFLPDGYKISLADLERQDAARLMQEAADRKKVIKAVIPRAAMKPKKSQGLPKTGGVPIQQGTSQLQPPPVKPVVSQLQPQQGPPRSQHPSGFRGRTPDDAVHHMSPPPTHMHASHHPTLPLSRPSPAQTHQPQSHQHPPQPHNLPPSQQPPPASLVQSSGAPQRAPIQGAPPSLPPAQPLPQHQAVEFDHAISYVTTIKKRFSNDPNTYHSFLEILHTYQKEQRGIKEVLEQVAHLFQDHPDLLKEFTFFLPDAVQEQAKERLHRAAAESESRQAAQRQQMMDQYHQRVGGQVSQVQGVVDIARRQTQQPEPDVRGRKRQMDAPPVPLVIQPESFVYNSAVERQFFDSAREALSSFTRDGGQAWAEFLKCLDMYAQEILSRSEMLNFVEPLLGKRNNNLFEEFKRILTAAGTASGSMALMEDSWYSVPLADIDFSRCRRCTPSYRALPRDYPAHPCSERNEIEARVLNDVWVSLPVGSEESYTFRHMRRNNYEETLFRVEDERFEIDMAIDSNAATLHRLEPIAEEIAQLARLDIQPRDLGLKEVEQGTGLGGKCFQYTFDKSILGVIHRNSIVRIYGDSGKEMLQLLYKNPSVAVPLVVNRLRQKHAEWIKVRSRLNRHWKEIAEQNYYKSLDHRSLTWRTIDKRAISARTLILEIKDRAANGGKEGKEAYRLKLDKAKEEHGTFYEKTVGSKLDQELDLTLLPKPDRRIFTPHQSIMYSNVSWAQRDAYRILAFALERGQISPADKERCHRLWVEFLGPWFGLPLSWMQKPAVSYQESFATTNKTISPVEPTVVSEEEDERSAEDNLEAIRDHVLDGEIPDSFTGAKDFTDHHPLPAGAFISTLYGEGKILEFRKSDHIYKVKLGFGAVAYLRSATVLCSMTPVENSAYTRELRASADDRTIKFRPNDHLAFGTQSLYLFFRLHHLLIQRLNIAKKLAYSVGSNSSLQSMVERIPNDNPKAVGKLRYEAYLSLLYSLLDGGMGAASEGGKYEDRLRSLLGHEAYELATMDKLISHIWKDIQIMANDENMWNLVQAYRRQLIAGSFQPESFRQEAAYLSDGELMYAFQHCPVSDSDESVLHMQYLGVMDDENDDPMEEEIETDEMHSNKRAKK